MEIPCEYEDVIEVGQANVPKVALKDDGHEPLECCRSISESKRHHAVLVLPEMGHKCRFPLGVALLQARIR